METNGLGGFAAAAVSGAHLRKYHALLVAAQKPPVQRMTLVNQLEETLSDARQEWKLSTHLYLKQGSSPPEAFAADEGLGRLVRFALDPWPVWTFAGDSWKLEKSLFMVYRQNTVVVRYRLLEGSDLRLRVRPLCSGRGFHHLQRENTALNPAPKVSGRTCSFEPYPGVPAFHFHHSGQFQPSFYWYRNFFYPLEKERGLEFLEDCWTPGEFEFALGAGDSASLVASTEPGLRAEVETLASQERARRESLVKVLKAKALEGRPPADDGELERSLELLLKSSDQFIVRREKHFKSIIAGYPWFNDWGRDTFISIFGLCFPVKRLEVAREIIEPFCRAMNRGVLPNYFPDSGEAPAFNTVDASLWFLLALYSYWKETRDNRFLTDLAWKKCVEIIQNYREGTHHNIRMDKDGLIAAGEPGLALTWMDARAGGAPVTPRAGKPVEIQALWFNALQAMSIMGMAMSESARAQEYLELAKRCQASFLRLFWNEDAGCLNDVLTDSGADASLRPNQIFAVSLPFELLDGPRAQALVEAVRRDLLTPYGLRTLAPGHPAYIGRYEGDALQRDRAYHQGTVWPWLMGPFITAYLKTRQYAPEAKAQALEWLAPLLRHCREAGTGTLPEIFDGDAPHRPRGSPTQAWSVGEILRVLIQDLKP